MLKIEVEHLQNTLFQMIKIFETLLNCGRLDADSETLKNPLERSLLSS